MAEFRLTFRTYALASTFCVLALVFRTWYIHEELYTVVAVLTTQKVALAVLYNFVFMVLVGTGKLVLHVLLGQLRDLEVEQVLDSGRGFLLDTVLFLVLSSPTLDGADVSTYALAKFLLFLVALKTAHLVVQIRGATMFEVGHPRVPALLRVCLVLSALLSMDLFAVHFFLVHASRQSTFYLWLLFECLGMLASCAICVVKFGVHLVDVRLDNGWTSKSAVIFYLELVHDVTSLGIFLLFMTVFFITQPSRLPLYMTADIIHVVKALYKRILSLKKYRSLTRNLETRFPDATPEELEAADTCIICRDFLYDGSKKLPCSHIFHIDCLRSWLVQQQSCPTCRAEIPTDDGSSPTPAPATSLANGAGGMPAGRSIGAQQQQQERSRGGSGASQVSRDGASSAVEGSTGGASVGPNIGNRHERIAVSSSIRAGGVSSAADEPLAAASAETAAGGHKLRSTDAEGAVAVDNGSTDLKEAEDVSDFLGPQDMGAKRSSERLETGAATAFATAAPAAAATYPGARASSVAAHRRKNHIQQVEAALRQRVMQTEAVVTDALAQALALSYHMAVIYFLCSDFCASDINHCQLDYDSVLLWLSIQCDVYRLHASLWTVEAQRAQLEVCRKLPQQLDTQGAENVSLSQTLTRTTNMNDASAAKASSENSTSAVKESAAVGSGTPLMAEASQYGAAGATGGSYDATFRGSKMSRDSRRQNEEGVKMRENSERDYVFICPHLFQRGSVPCIYPSNMFFPIAPIPHGAGGGCSVDGGDSVTEKRGDCLHHSVVADMHSCSGSSISSHNGTSAISGASSTLALDSYGTAAATGHCPICGFWNASPEVWQNMQGLCYNGVSPLPSSRGSRSCVHTGVGELPAAQQHSMSPARSNLPATTRAQQNVIPSAHLTTPSPTGKPVSREDAETHLFTSSNPLGAHVRSRARKTQIRGEEEAVDNLSGNSSHTLSAPEESLVTASAESGEKLDMPGSHGTAARVFDEGTRAMAAELERLRREQHRKWKSGGTADNGSHDD